MATTDQPDQDRSETPVSAHADGYGPGAHPGETSASYAARDAAELPPDGTLRSSDVPGAAATGVAPVLGTPAISGIAGTAAAGDSDAERSTT